jgi:hypothetical protein
MRFLQCVTAAVLLHNGSVLPFVSAKAAADEVCKTDEGCNSDTRVPAAPAFEPDIALLVDTDRYPIFTPESATYQLVVATARKEIAELGSVGLEGFIREDKIQAMASEVMDLPGAFNRLSIVSPYGTGPGGIPLYFYDKSSSGAPMREMAALQNVSNWDALPLSHPMRRKFAQDTHAVASDLIAKESAVRKVYDSKAVAAFLADILKVPLLFHFDDE